jgi:RecG-like helicase
VCRGEHVPTSVHREAQCQCGGSDAHRQACAKSKPESKLESKPAPKPESRPESDADDPLVQPLLGLPGVGPVTAEKLAVKGLTRVIDALYFLPKRYDDLRQVVPVGQLQPGVLQATVVLVERTKVVWARKRFLEVMFRGEDGCELLARWFYFHGGYQKRLLPGKRFLLTATPSKFRDSLQVTHPELTDLPPRTEQTTACCPREVVTSASAIPTWKACRVG